MRMDLCLRRDDLLYSRRGDPGCHPDWNGGIPRLHDVSLGMTDEHLDQGVYIRRMQTEIFRLKESGKEKEERPQLVYIAHPMGGDIGGNKKKVIEICKQILSPGIIPFTPYLSAFEYLDDTDPVQRQLGMEMNRFYFERRIIDILLICGDIISSGVRSEIKLALENGIPMAILDESRKEEIENVVKEILKELFD